MPRKRTSRIYWRNQGGERRAYGDFRDVGGGREALIPEREERATTDLAVAEKLVASRLEELQETKRDRVLLGVRRRAGLQEYAAEHLVKKAKSGSVTTKELVMSEHRLGLAVAFFGAGRDLGSIGVEHVQEYAHWLATQSNGRGATLSPATQRKALNTLSGLFRRAQGEGLIRGVNPVAALVDKPVADPAEAAWLEVWEGALLLEAARLYPYGAQEDDRAGGRLLAALGPSDTAQADFVARMRAEGKLASGDRLAAYLSGERIPTKDYVVTAERVLDLAPGELWRPKGWRGPSRPLAQMYPLIATFLLTGGRESEVTGLLIGDVSLRRETVTFRKHAHRRLKTRTSNRTIPYWPQLREILEPHIEERRRADAGDRDLLFVARDGGMVGDIRRSLDAIAARAGWRAGEIRTKAFRHAYASARLQTLDNGHPVAERTIADELGHGGHDLVRRVYGHLGRIRHRSEGVEYRIEQQREHIPAERLRLLALVA